MIVLAFLFAFLWISFSLHIRKMERLERETICLLKQILAILTAVEVADELTLFAIIDGQEVKVDNMNLKKGQRIELIAKASAKGKPAQIDGEVNFTIPAGLVLVDDGGKKYLQPTDDATPGAVLVMADADGDLGEGVKMLHAEGAINILEADADTLEITFGTPEDIPAPAAP